MILIRGGKVYDGKGNILENTDILIEGSTIKDIGENILVSKDTEIFDAKGKVVFPGFIESLNIWGAMGPGWEDNDLGEHSDPITPEMNVVYSFDQDSMMFQRVFEYGITSAGITPSTSNVLGGYGAVFKTYGKHPYEMLVKEKVAMVSSISKETKNLYGKRNIAPMTKMGAIALLKEALIKAMEYDEKQDKDYDPKAEALQDVIHGKVPLFINCNTKAEMDAIELALKSFPVEVVFTGAFGVGANTGSIMANDYSIILGDLANGMAAANNNVDFESIQKLMNNGIDIAISSGGDNMSSGKESLLWNAILCYKNGINSEDVLKMITSIPAKILGVDSRVGSIEIGKDADIVVWSNNPIKTYAAKVEATFINGENILNARRVDSCW
mgnify:FL=1